MDNLYRMFSLGFVSMVTHVDTQEVYSTPYTTIQQHSPIHVGDHYYCESGNTGVNERTLFINDPLWDGEGCGADNNCCAQPGMPWFCLTLPQEVEEDIEVRLCSDQGGSDPEDMYGNTCCYQRTEEGSMIRTVPKTFGRNHSTPAMSCLHIYQCEQSPPSGPYRMVARK